jgi:hypothetical protein
MSDPIDAPLGHHRDVTEKQLSTLERATHGVTEAVSVSRDALGASVRSLPERL